MFEGLNPIDPGMFPGLDREEVAEAIAPALKIASQVGRETSDLGITLAVGQAIGLPAIAKLRARATVFHHDMYYPERPNWHEEIFGKKSQTAE